MHVKPEQLDHCFILSLAEGLRSLITLSEANNVSEAAFSLQLLLRQFEGVMLCA
jgi:hypothetical protein